MATVLDIVHVSRPHNDLSLISKHFYIKFAKFLGAASKGLWGLLSSQAAGLQTKLQGKHLGVLPGQAERLQTRLQGRGFEVLPCQVEGLQTRLQGMFFS